MRFGGFRSRHVRVAREELLVTRSLLGAAKSLMARGGSAEQGLRVRAQEAMSWGMASVRAPAYTSRRRLPNTACDVFVFDTGVDLRHPDLRRGFSISFVGSEPSAQDLNGHGTAVSTIIGALDNGRGLVGVAPGARIHSMKVLDASGEGYVRDIVAAVNFMILWHQGTSRFRGRARNSVVANFSLGGYVGSTDYTPIDDAIRLAVSNGITCVVAAGNEAADAQLYTPAHCREAIAVGSYGRLPDGRLSPSSLPYFSSWSNHGPALAILAPGEDVLAGRSDAGFQVQTVSGTSFATPKVSGAAAYYLSRRPMQVTRQAVLVRGRNRRWVRVFRNRVRASLPSDVSAWLQRRRNSPTVTGLPANTTASALYMG